jgi:hypothetical protein
MIRKFLIIFLLLSSLTFGRTVKELTSRELHELYWDCDFIYQYAPELLTGTDLLVCIAIYDQLVQSKFNNDSQKFLKWRNNNVEFEYQNRRANVSL